MKIKFLDFQELSATKIYEILKLRSEVFVVEQNCIYNDLDNLDQEALHCVAKDDQKIVGYCRILKPGTRFKEASLGRIVVAKDYRNKGLAAKMIMKATKRIFKEWNLGEIKISAQQHLEDYYGGLGYETCSEPYLEDGIPHLEMILKKAL